MNGDAHSPPVIASPQPQLNISPGTHVSYQYSHPPTSSSHPRGFHGLGVPSDVGHGHEGSSLVHMPTPTGGEFRVGHQRKKLILCFDGTGNKFKGNAGDTNILKIFRMLDRSSGENFHYYQPGIGTYITNGTLSRIHVGSRMKSWAQKAMDAAVGTSFDQHVIGGYKFLMRFYAPGDDIYMFGFSRGAYTARFLAEMLDHVGLVSQGNEEMVLFAWKTFSNWQQRQDNEKKQQMYNYMQAFRETFARPVRRVRFLGLFDTVNSVPRFEQAWLKRSCGFPYTARSTARVVRHAVGIDERRAKFRQDLVEKIDIAEIRRHRSWKAERRKQKAKKKMKFLSPSTAGSPKKDGTRQTSKMNLSTNGNGNPVANEIYRAQALSGLSSATGSMANLSVQSGGHGSMVSLNILMENESDSEDEDEKEQNIEEVWFPGCHGDIGGGWDLPEDEEPLSQGPLVWMVREARKAGVVFDKQRMKEQNCWIDEFDEDSSSSSLAGISLPNLPHIEVTSTSTPTSPTIPNGNILSEKPPVTDPPAHPHQQTQHPDPHHQQLEQQQQRHSDSDKHSHDYLHRSYTHSKIHDCLLFNNGIGHVGVLGWKMMEYLPFRRMDLQPDGSWKAIIWPLPCGEVRDIPDHVKIHCSVIKRMEADSSYRPGNLLVGGGGRGCRVAPKEYGTGDWVVIRDRGNLVGEVLMKRTAWEDMKQKEKHRRAERRSTENEKDSF